MAGGEGGGGWWDHPPHLQHWVKWLWERVWDFSALGGPTSSVSRRAVKLTISHYYRIAGIFRGGKYSFFSNKSSFRAFYFRFCFTSAILHYSRPHPFCEISFFGLILERKKRKLNPTKITRYTVFGAIATPKERLWGRNPKPCHVHDSKHWEWVGHWWVWHAQWL